MKKILVIGSLNMDLVTHVKTTPRVGETVLGNGYSEIPGGKGANQAVAIGRLGGEVSMLGMVGSDNFGQVLTSNLKINNVSTGYLYETNDESTGLAMIMVNQGGDNSIVVVPGANFELTPDKIKDEHLKDIDYVLGQLETPIETIEEIFARAKKKGIKTILNPAPARKLGENLIKNIDLLIPNETEFQLMTGITADTNANIRIGAKKLFKSGVKEIIITLGEDGAFYLNSDGKEYRAKGYQVLAVDTTAAGDSFIGGLLTQLSLDKSIEEAIDYGMKVGAVTVSRHGAQSSLPNADDIENFIGEKYT